MNEGSMEGAASLRDKGKEMVLVGGDDGNDAAAAGGGDG